VRCPLGPIRDAGNLLALSCTAPTTSTDETENVTLSQAYINA